VVRPLAGLAMSSEGGEEVMVREFFNQYKKSINALANTPQPRSLWIHQLHALTNSFETEMAALDSTDDSYSREELCAVLEREALDATSTHRRDVLIVAVRTIEYRGVMTRHADRMLADASLCSWYYHAGLLEIRRPNLQSIAKNGKANLPQ
jgi:hypothetical protein